MSRPHKQVRRRLPRLIAMERQILDKLKEYDAHIKANVEQRNKLKIEMLQLLSLKMKAQNEREVKSGGKAAAGAASTSSAKELSQRVAEATALSDKIAAAPLSDFPDFNFDQAEECNRTEIDLSITKNLTGPLITEVEMEDFTEEEFDDDILLDQDFFAFGGLSRSPT